MTGFLAPISSTSGFSPAIVLVLYRSAIDPGEHDAHQHNADGVIADLLERQRKRHRRHHVINQISRDHGQEGDSDAEADALCQPRLVLFTLKVNPSKGDAEECLR